MNSSATKSNPTTNTPTQSPTAFPRPSLGPKQTSLNQTKEVQASSSSTSSTTPTPSNRTNISKESTGTVTTLTDADPTTKTASKPTLNMFSFVNIQGLCPQTKPSSLPYLKDLTNCSKQLFLALTETSLTDNHKKGELEIKNYKFFKKTKTE